MIASDWLVSLKIVPTVPLDFLEATNFDHAYRDFPKKILNERLGAIASAFEVNMERIHCTCFMLVDIVAWVFQYDQIVEESKRATQARLNAGEKIDPQFEFMRKVSEDFWKFCEQARVNLHPMPPDTFAKAAQQVAGTLNSVGTIRVGLEAGLISMLTGSYTAIESLCIDLWLHAVNNRPRSLAANAIKSNEGVFDKQTGPTVLFADLMDFDFNIRDRMGDLLKKREGCRWNRLAESAMRMSWYSEFQKMPTRG